MDKCVHNAIFYIRKYFMKLKKFLIVFLLPVLFLFAGCQKNEVLEVSKNLSTYNIDVVYNLDKTLEGKLNNIETLKNLARVSDVDTIHTTMSNNKFLPRNTVYTTLASKKINGGVVFGFDTVILSKDAADETVSKNVFESAQRSLGKMWGNLVQHPIMRDSRNPDSSFKSLFKKFTNMFKK